MCLHLHNTVYYIYASNFLSSQNEPFLEKIAVVARFVLILQQYCNLHISDQNICGFTATSD